MNRATVGETPGKGWAMEWFIIEALVALAVGVAIVWWTMAPRKKLPRDRDTKSAGADKT